jgi:hypothetical protein
LKHFLVDIIIFKILNEYLLIVLFLKITL